MLRRQLSARGDLRDLLLGGGYAAEAQARQVIERAAEGLGQLLITQAMCVLVGGETGRQEKRVRGSTLTGVVEMGHRFFLPFFSEESAAPCPLFLDIPIGPAKCDNLNQKGNAPHLCSGIPGFLCGYRGPVRFWSNWLGHDPKEVERADHLAEPALKRGGLRRGFPGEGEPELCPGCAGFRPGVQNERRSWRAGQRLPEQRYLIGG